MTIQKTKFDQPDGFQFGQFKNERGYDVRYGHMKSTSSDASNGTLVLGPGYGEPIEKYFELINDLTAAGYDIWIMDWVGQGGSSRHDPSDPQRSYDLENFVEHHRDDLYHLTTQIMSPPKDHKIGYMGFSLGAHIGFRFMSQYPYIFDMAAMNAALMDVKTKNRFHRSIIPSMTKSLRLRGCQNEYIPGGGDWSEDKHDFTKNKKTHDERRFRVLKDVFNSNAGLQVGDVRVNWVHHLLPSIHKLNRKMYLEDIRAPVFLSIAGDDQTVSVKAQRRAAKHLFNAHSAEYLNARHELWMEADRIRSPWLKNMLNQISGVMKSDIPPVRISRRVSKICSNSPPERWFLR
jgi:lysophospholipase